MPLKRILPILTMTFLLTFSFTACGESTASESKNSDSDVSQLVDALSDDDSIDNSSDTSVNNDIVINDEDEEEITIVEDETIEDTYTYSDDSSIMIVAYDTDVHFKPEEDSSTFGTCIEGEPIAVTGQCIETDWWRVDCDGTIGYVAPDAVYSSNDDSAETLGTVIRPWGEIDFNYLASAAQSYNQLPLWVQCLFEAQEWTIYVRTDNYGEPWGYSDLLGLTVYSDHTIYLTASEAGTGTLTVLHELGHFIDYVSGLPSNNDAFIITFENEYDEFADFFSYSHFDPSPSEMWAQACAYYWTVPDQLRTVAPQTYLYLDGIIGQEPDYIETID